MNDSRPPNRASILPQKNRLFVVRQAALWPGRLVMRPLIVALGIIALCVGVEAAEPTYG